MVTVKARPTLPPAAPEPTNYIGDALNAVWTTLGSGVSAITSETSSLLSSLQSPLRHKAPKELDEIIELFTKLQSYTKGIALGNASTAKGIEGSVFNPKSLTLYDLKAMIEELKDSSSKYFMMQELGDHAEPFDALIASLEAEIENAEDPNNQSNDIASVAYKDPKTGHIKARLTTSSLECLNALATKLRQLKHERAGYITRDYWSQPENPNFIALVKELQNVTDTILKDPNQPDKILKSYDKLEAFLHADFTFAGFKDPSEVIRLSAEVIEAFQHFRSLPKSLQKDHRLSPNPRDLHIKLSNLVKAISPQVKATPQVSNSITSKILNKLLTSIKDAGEAKLNEMGILSFVHSAEEESFPDGQYHCLQIFHDAVAYFDSDDCLTNADEQASYLEALAQDCDRIIPDFQSNFEANLDNTSGPNLNTEALLQTLRDCATTIHPELQEHLDILKSESFEGLARYVLGDDLEIQPIEEAHPSHESSTSLTGFASNALKLLNQSHASLSSIPLKFLGCTFKGLLDSTALTNWLDNQPAEVQGILGTIFSATKTALAAAIASGKISDYKQVFEKFLHEYKSHHFGIDGIELPSLSDEVIDDDIKDSFLQKRLFSMVKPMSDLNDKVIDDKDYHAETSKQSKLLSKNSSHFLVYTLLQSKFFSPILADNVNQPFFDIMTRLKVAPEEQNQDELFIQEIKSLIDRQPGMWQIKKWFLKLIVPTLHKWASYHISRFIDKALVYLRDTISHIDESSKESAKTRKDIVHRLNHSVGTYQNMLEAWATKGGDKITVLGQLSGDTEFNEGLTEVELMNKCSQKAVDKFLAELDISSLPKRAAGKLTHFIFKPHFSTHSVFRKLAHFFISGAKLFFVGTPGYLVLGAAYIVSAIANLILDKTVRSAVKHVLSSNQLLANVVEETKSSIYEQNPYVNVVTEALALQLEDLSTTLDEIQNKATKTPTSSSSEKIEIPDQTRIALKSTLENLFELLNKNRFSTKDKLKDYLNKRSLTDQTLESLDELVMPGVIDAIIDAVVVGSHTIANKNFIEKQVSSLLEKTNSIITTNGTLSEDKLKQLKEESISNQNRVKTQLDKILRQIVRMAVDNKLNEFGQRQFLETEAIRNWIQETLVKDKSHDGKSLLSHLKSQLKDLYNHPENLNPEALVVLKDKSTNFLKELMNKLSALEDSSLSARSKQKLKNELDPLIKIFETFTDKNHFRKLYRNSEKLTHIEQDKPTIDKIKKASETIYENLHLIEELNPRNDQELISQALSIISLNEELVQEGLSIIKNKKIVSSSKKDLAKIASVQGLLESNDHAIFVKQQPIIANLQKTRGVLQGLTENLFADLHAAKETNLRNNNTFFRRLLTALRIRRDHAYTALATIVNLSIQTIPYKETRKQLAKLLKDYQDLSDINLINAKRDEIVDVLQDLSEEYEESFNESMEDSRDFTSKVITETIELSTKWSEANHTLRASNQEILKDGRDNLISTLSQMKTIVKNMQPINLPHIQTGAIDKLKKMSQAVVYSRLKPKADQAIHLLQAGSFATHVAKHLLFVPFAKP